MELPEDRTQCRVYHYKDDDVDMNFQVVVTLRGSTVAIWIHDVKTRYLDAAPMKIVGLDCEFTDAAVGMQRVAVLQLSVATDTLVFHICHADRVSEALRDFLMDTTIKFYGAAIHNDQHMLRPYGIHIPSVVDLQKVLQPNPHSHNLLSLYDLANFTIGTNLPKKEKGEKLKKGEEDLRFGWGNFPLSYFRIMYAYRDACLGYEIAS